MKYRVKNKKSKKYMCKPVSSGQATKLCRQLNLYHGTNDFTIESTSADAEQIPETIRELTMDELEAIEELQHITFPTGVNHKSFAQSLLALVESGGNQISDRAAAYLWYIIHRYRRQLRNTRIIRLSELNKVY